MIFTSCHVHTQLINDLSISGDTSRPMLRPQSRDPSQGQYPEINEMLLGDHDVFQFLQRAVKMKIINQACLDTGTL
jgi:hypothetical protein